MDREERDGLDELRQLIREEREALEEALRRGAGLLAPLADTFATRMDRLEEAVEQFAARQRSEPNALPGEQQQVARPQETGLRTWFGLGVSRGPTWIRPQLPKAEEAKLDRRVVRAQPIFSIGDNQIDRGGMHLCTDEDLAELNWGLANGRATILGDWSDVRLAVSWVDHFHTYPDHNPILRAPAIRPPWNAVVRYEPAEGYREMYFAARVANAPTWVWQISVPQDDLPAFIACLAIGTLHAIRAGKMPVDVGAKATILELLWWLDGLVPEGITEILNRVRFELGSEERVNLGRKRPRKYRNVTSEEIAATSTKLISRLEAELAKMPNPMWLIGGPSEGELRAWGTVAKR